jgi:hypothetical protein
MQDVRRRQTAATSSACNAHIDITKVIHKWDNGDYEDDELTSAEIHKLRKKPGPQKRTRIYRRTAASAASYQRMSPNAWTG